MEKLSGIQKELENRCWKTSEKNSPAIVLTRENKGGYSLAVEKLSALLHGINL